MASHIVEGYAFALVVYATVWGFTVPIRWFFKQLGFSRD